MENLPKKYIYLIITVLVIAFNLIAVFGLDVLYINDWLHYYKNSIDGNYYKWMFRFSFTTTFIYYVIFNIMYFRWN